MVKITTNSPEETIAFAQKVGALLKGGDVIAYKGSMGAGKTTFTRGTCSRNGLARRGNLPTFALVNEYREHYSIPFRYVPPTIVVKSATYIPHPL